MFHLVYVSTAANPFSKADLLELLSQSRERNARLGITGILLYRDGNLMQLLEGEASRVQEVFADIRADRRHRSLFVIVEEAATERLFADWSMAFRDLADPTLASLPGYSQFMNQGIEVENFRSNPDACWALLDFFRQGR